jgi:predicted nucleotidyltransferase component of viral defense system
VKLPVHAAYPTPATLPVMALVENMAEKVARLNRACPARDVYDMVGVAGTTPHSTFDEPLLRRTGVLTCWVDLQP